MRCNRVFNERTTQRFTRKPCNLLECALVEFNGEDLEAIPLITFTNGLRGLDREIEALPPETIEFAALNETTGRCYLVNTEGATYARYAGLLANGDANALALAKLDAEDALEADA